MLIKTSLPVYTSKETSASSGGMRLYNHKDILVIYLLFGSHAPPQQASPSYHPPSLLSSYYYRQSVDSTRKRETYGPLFELL